MTERSAEEIVRAKYPNAELLALPHGKVACWSRSQAGSAPLGYLGDIQYSGTREERNIKAWQSAAARIKASEKEANRDS